MVKIQSETRELSELTQQSFIYTAMTQLGCRYLITANHLINWANNCPETKICNRHRDFSPQTPCQWLWLLYNPPCQGKLICEPCPLTACLWKYCCKGHRLKEPRDRGERNVCEIAVASCIAGRALSPPCLPFKSQRARLIIPVKGVGLIPGLEPLLIPCFIVLWFPF